MSLLDRAIVRAYSQRTSALAASLREPIATGAHTPAPVSLGQASQQLTPDLIHDSAIYQDAEVATATLPEVSAPPSEKQPAYITAKPKIEPFTWTWPRIVQQLLNQAEYGFLHLSQQLTAAAKSHRKKVIAFISSAQGDGCTSVMLTIAQILSRQKDIRTLIVEANPGHPAQLDLLQATGDCLKELKKSNRRISTPERPWRLSGDNLMLMPISLQDAIVPSDSDRSGWENSILRRMPGWRNEYDLILMDLGPVQQNQNVSDLWWNEIADRVITIASSTRLAANPQGFVDDSAWEQAGIEPLGVIETFA